MNLVSHTAVAQMCLSAGIKRL